MSKPKSAQPVTANASDVRKHFNLPVQRGRLSKGQIASFEAETGKTYVVPVRTAPQESYTVKFTHTQKSGRKVTKTKDITLAEARVLAGPAAGLRGRLSAKAWEAISEGLSTKA